MKRNLSTPDRENSLGSGPVRKSLAAAILCALTALSGCQGGGGGNTRANEPVQPDAFAEVSAEPNEPRFVTVRTDSGAGSLRQALIDSNAAPGPDVIVFDSQGGVFGPPQTITLHSELPEITGDLTLDGYLEDFLWQSAGVIISGNGEHRILSVSPGAKVSVRNLTLADGRAKHGGAVLNRGRLVVSGVTAINNEASRDGGAISNQKGEVFIINSTLVDNRARGKGGGVASKRGTLTITNSTFSGNAASNGGAVFSSDTLALRNSILANSESKSDCSLSGRGDAASTHNIIERNNSCPGALHEADPKLDRLDYFNGMTKTISLGMRSLALNAGNNRAAVDENGDPLVWDQRGNGDPRFVAGYTDIGAFETQAFPKLVVDTLEDSPIQGCGGGSGDCPLRAAIRLAEASGKPEVITFDLNVFKDHRILELQRPLAVPTSNVTIDASSAGGLSLRAAGNQPVFEGDLQSNVKLIGIRITLPPSK